MILLLISSIKSLYQLRHFNQVNFVVFSSYIQYSSGMSFTQETSLKVDLKKVLDGSQNNASFSLLDALFLLFSVNLRQTVFSTNGILY